MNTIIQKVEKEHPDETVLKQAGEILKSGGLVAFPTETVYGLGGDGLNARSSEKIYAAKGRPSDNPLIIHISKKKDHISTTQTMLLQWRSRQERDRWILSSILTLP